jgi:hypothetical protein
MEDTSDTLKVVRKFAGGTLWNVVSTYIYMHTLNDHQPMVRRACTARRFPGSLSIVTFHSAFVVYVLGR